MLCFCINGNWASASDSLAGEYMINLTISVIQRITSTGSMHINVGMCCLHNNIVAVVTGPSGADKHGSRKRTHIVTCAAYGNRAGIRGHCLPPPMVEPEQMIHSKKGNIRMICIES